MAYRDLSEMDWARDYLTQALAIYQAIKPPAAEQVRGRLAELHPRSILSVFTRKRPNGSAEL